MVFFDIHQYNEYMKIRKADNYETVKQFYDDIIDKMQDSIYKPLWQKGIYPSDEYLKESIENHQLYVGIENNQIIGAMIVNHDSNESYNKMTWQIEADKDEVLLIHALGVLPEYSNKGYAKHLVQYVIDMGKENLCKAIRLDVLYNNVPALKLYEGIGFKKLDTIQMYYEDTGWTDFCIYEYII